MFERHLTGKSVEKSVEEIRDCLDEVNETFEKEKEENMRQIKSLGTSNYSKRFEIINPIIHRGEKLE